MQARELRNDRRVCTDLTWVTLPWSANIQTIVSPSPSHLSVHNGLNPDYLKYGLGIKSGQEHSTRIQTHDKPHRTQGPAGQLKDIAFAHGQNQIIQT